MKELKDYLHLYLGCEVIGEYDNEPRRGYLTGIHGEYEAEIQFFEEDGINVFEEPEYNKFSQVKPILRPLWDMTEDEKREYNIKKQSKGYMAQKHAGNTLWLLSKRFDLFHLIEAGLAIYKTTIKENA